MFCLEFAILTYTVPHEVKTLLIFGLADHFKNLREALKSSESFLLLCHSFKIEILKTGSALSQSVTVSLLVSPRLR